MTPGGVRVGVGVGVGVGVRDKLGVRVGARVRVRVRSRVEKLQKYTSPHFYTHHLHPDPDLSPLTPKPHAPTNP